MGKGPTRVVPNLDTKFLARCTLALVFSPPLLVDVLLGLGSGPGFKQQGPESTCLMLFDRNRKNLAITQWQKYHSLEFYVITKVS